MKRNDELEKEMFSMVESWRESDFSHEKFCNENGVSVSKFKYWQKKYRLAKGRARVLKSQDKKFVSLQLKQEKLKSASKIELHFPCGVQVFCEVDTLKELIPTLSRRKNV